MIKNVDEDGNGKVSYEEFVNYMMSRAEKTKDEEEVKDDQYN